MSAPWLEEWHCESRGMGLVFGVYGIYGQPVPMRLDTREGAPRARLAAAAPALVRALLAVEWTQLDDGYDGCADCRRSKDGYSTVDHDNPCALDAALTAAGLPDQASRDEARRQIEARTNR